MGGLMLVFSVPSGPSEMPQTTSILCSLFEILILIAGLALSRFCVSRPIVQSKINSKLNANCV